MALHLSIGPLKTRSGLELVPRFEPSTYQPITTAPSGPVSFTAYCIPFILDKSTHTGPNGAVPMSSANGLVGAEFSSWYWLQPRECFF